MTVTAAPQIEAPPEKLLELARLQAIRRAQLAESQRAAAARWETPGQLAKAIDSDTVQTPALDTIDEALAWAYTTRDARLLVSMPPQEGKSSRVTKVGSLWALVRNPDLRLGIASYAQSLAEGFGRDIRNWITSFQGDDDTLDLGLQIAPDYGSARRWKLNGHRGGVVTVGIGSGLTGRPLDALIIDDPFADAEQADSPYFRERVWSWWQSVGAPRLAPGAPVIVILTRWHEDDLAGRLLAAEDGHRWRVINIPALADHNPAKGEKDPLGREPGEWLASARQRTVAEWEQIRIQSGSRVFTALYQGRPSPDAGNVWLRHWWRRYVTPLWSQHPDRPEAYTVHDVDELLMSWDMSFKATSGSDYVAGQVWARRGADVFLLDQVHRRLTFTETLTAFKALAARWPQAHRKLIEAAANGQAVIDSLKSEIPGIVPVKPKETKLARASAVAPFVEAGNVHLPAPGIALFDAEALVTEASGFPNAAHDDQVDATSQALRQMLLDGTGAEAWISWAQRKAAQLAALQLAGAAALSGCLKPDCTREPATGSPFCCAPCVQADAGGYEVHETGLLAHTAECDQRTGVQPTVTPPEPRQRKPRRYTRAQMLKATDAIAAGRVTAAGEPGTWQVHNGASSYLATSADGCTCPAGVHGRACWHALAAQLAENGTEPPRAPQAPAAAAAAAPAPAEPVDGVTARKRARDAAFRQQRGNW